MEKITFKHHWFFGGEKKDGSNDYVIGYHASNGKYIDIVESFDNCRDRYYKVDGKIFYTLKESKEYCINCGQQ